ncbi:peptide antibiotic transporter SbmA [Nitratireductor mangrovi]|uniref:Peptide antibiotic transporter SbmA n=1 Tax=Nitratireductor mangrovi TaxID=2599600 RepID=A0A5B8KXT9_9HYPH|nr:peptide antibiotic transporter SbmA [Nitratireductor mangrovi]QDZ00443.1 peptide antibiotic transporter SbmA [Nitratireductor mangrovi]
MFVSFFPKPKLLFTSAALWALFGVLFWYFFAKDAGGWLSLGGWFGYGFPAELGAEADDAARAAFEQARSGALEFWFYQYFIAILAIFIGFWMVYSPHPWQRWSLAGSALILFVNWFLVQLDVMINEWFGTFYDMVQKALGTPNSVSATDYYWQVATFLQIALVYVFVASLFRFFVSHFIFRWRTAMNEYYMQHWPRLRHIEGAAQRVQEDTMRFATISENLGVSFVDAIMTLIAFLPLLWGLSANVTELPIIGEVSQGLVFVVILWSIFGTALVALAGIRLPGLEFRNQRVEAAYRKELVYGEDHAERAQPQTVVELFADIRKNYFRLYLNYLYFNLVRIFYLQIGVMVPYIALAPTIVSGTITLGVMQQIIRAFQRVENSFQYLINSWSTIVELMSVYKRLKAFETTLEGEPLPEIEQEYLARQGGTPG